MVQKYPSKAVTSSLGAPLTGHVGNCMGSFGYRLAGSFLFPIKPVKTMKKIYAKFLSLTGKGLITLAVLFFFIFNFVVKGDPNSNTTYDLFNFVIPQPPVWTSHVPYVGFLLEALLGLFSVHGLVFLSIFIALMYVGFFLLGWSKKIGNKLVTTSKNHLRARVISALEEERQIDQDSKTH